MTNVITRDTFEIIKSAVRKTAEIVKPTYGPAANKVIISKLTHGMVVDDGVQICRDLDLEDANENAVMKIVREVAIRTNDRVGDGTTGAIILTEALIDEVAKIPNHNGRKIEKELKKGFEEAEKKLRASAQQISSKADLLKVAKASFDDPKVAEVIADTWFKIGKDGMVTIDRSGTMETFAEATDGIKLNQGYISPYMVTNPARMEAVIEKPYILLTDYRLTEVNDILVAMNILAAKQLVNLVVICDNLEQNALSTVIVNKMQGKFNVVAINTPAGDNTLEDIAILTGAKFFSQKKGDKIDTIKIEDFGRAERFISREKESVIIGPRGQKAPIAKAIADLRTAITSADTDSDKEKITNRLAFFTNKIAVIKVGAATANEVNALRYKVEDAVHATHSAFKNGIVCGAGLSLARLETSSQILNRALQAPFAQLMINMGMDTNIKDLKKDEAINVVTGEIGNYFKVGVVDPVDVIIAQLESAISITGLLITSKGMIIDIPVKLKQE